MKRSELRQIVKEEIIREGLIGKVLDSLKASADNAAKRKAVEKINTKVADNMAKLASVEKELEQMLSSELTDEELDELLKKLK